MWSPSPPCSATSDTYTPPHVAEDGGYGSPPNFVTGRRLGGNPESDVKCIHFAPVNCTACSDVQVVCGDTAAHDSWLCMEVNLTDIKGKHGLLRRLGAAEGIFCPDNTCLTPLMIVDPHALRDALFLLGLAGGCGSGAVVPPPGV